MHMTSISQSEEFPSYSVGKSCLTLCDPGRTPGFPTPSPGVCSNSCPLSWWCHPTLLSSVVPFFSHRQSFPAPGSFPMSRLFTVGGQCIGVSVWRVGLFLTLTNAASASKGWGPFAPHQNLRGDLLLPASSTLGVITLYFYNLTVEKWYHHLALHLLGH